MSKVREIDVYWAMQNGRRWTVSLDEAGAWKSTNSIETGDSGDWTIEKTRELVYVIQGEVVKGEGVAVTILDDEGCETSEQPYKSVAIFWECPLCNQAHHRSLYEDPVNQTNPVANPSVWFCENGEGIVMVRW